jgi:hypothetical protein
VPANTVSSLTFCRCFTSRAAACCPYTEGDLPHPLPTGDGLGEGPGEDQPLANVLRAWGKALGMWLPLIGAVHVTTAAPFVTTAAPPRLLLKIHAPGNAAVWRPTCRARPLRLRADATS